MEDPHPGLNVVDIRPSALNAQVTGMDFLPDGRMVFCTWVNFGNMGEVYIVDGAQTGDKSKVTYKQFATGLYEPCGLKVVNGAIYVLAKDALLRLPDANGDDKADKVETLVKGWSIQKESAGTKNLEFALGLEYKNGIFYAGLATRWPLNMTSTSERGCILALDTNKASSFETIACGLRTPNGLTFGPEGELFITENQGNWVPDSKLIHVVKDRFYGVHKPQNAHPLESKPESPPAVWLPQGEVGVSPTQPLMLKTGTFKGQMVAGDNRLGTLQRYFLEKVKGEYQGMVIKFTAGLEEGGSRLVEGPDSALYVGSNGASGSIWSGWSWTTKYKGLARITEKPGVSYFDIFAIRSTGETTFEIEFTEPADNAAGTAGNYTVSKRTYAPVEAYGQGGSNWSAMNVTSAVLSADKKKVTLTLSGLQKKTAVRFQFKNFKAASGHNLWANQAWYTLNEFGPAEIVSVSTWLPRPKAKAALRADFIQGRLHLQNWDARAFEYEIFDFKGSQVARGQGMGAEIKLEAGLSRGIYRIRVQSPEAQASVPFAVF